MSDSTPQHATFDNVIDVEDNTGNLLPKDQQAEVPKHIKDAQAEAKRNYKAEQKENSSEPVEALGDDENVENAQETARLNAKAEQDRNDFDGYGIAKNDTTDAGKVRTSKSQLDPTGKDPISDAEVKRAALNGEDVKGTTSVSNKEAAHRAEQNGKVEENSDFSVAGKGVAEGATEATKDATHTNSNETKTTGEGGIAKEAGPENQSGKNATTQSENQTDKN